MSGDAGIKSVLPIGTNRLPRRIGLDAGPIRRENIFEILSNERRRFVLRYLREHGRDRVEFRGLVDQVAAWENETTQDRLSSDDRKCVYTALRQTHLPKLHRLGLVEFDNRRGCVERTDATDAIYPYMDYAPERERLRSRFYLSLAVVGVLSAFLVWTHGTRFGGVPIAAVAAAVFGVSAAVRRRRSVVRRLRKER